MQAWDLLDGGTDLRGELERTVQQLLSPQHHLTAPGVESREMRTDGLVVPNRSARDCRVAGSISGPWKTEPCSSPLPIL
jgi:hypothetical protein